MKPVHLAVEGPIGVGKTTLARRLASHLGAREILEDPRNPFLADFYTRRPGAAFQCQAWFLLTRHVQQRDLLQPELFLQASVADYIFAKDRIFAHLNLDAHELEIYERLYAAISEPMPRPDLVVYLQASDEVLLERVRKRRRPEEATLSREYLSDVNRAY